MNVFIDTNILLDIYHLSGTDLEEVRKIAKLTEAHKINLLMTRHVLDEFTRNRERVIAEALETFSKTKASYFLPNLVRGYEKTVELKVAMDKANALVKEIQKNANADIKDNKILADKVIDELFSKAPLADITDDIYAKAVRRSRLGNPPGKAGSFGDAVNWEWLLETLPEGQDILIISADGDYESELAKGSVKQFLYKEWHDLKKGVVVLYKSLPEFLQKHFPEIKLADEIDKVVAIENLENSFAFASTHKAIAALDKYDDFTEGELIRLINAYKENGQVYRIIGDTDVFSFGKKITALCKTEKTIQAIEGLNDMLVQVEDWQKELGVSDDQCDF